MNHLMIDKSGFLNKGFVTDGTIVWFVPGVHINMPFKIVPRRKRLSALLAYIIFALVPQHMFVEVLLTNQWYLTFLTSIFALVVFVFLMRDQGMTIAKDFATNIAIHRMVLPVSETTVFR